MKTLPNLPAAPPTLYSKQRGPYGLVCASVSPPNYYGIEGTGPLTCNDPSFAGWITQYMGGFRSALCPVTAPAAYPAWAHIASQHQAKPDTWPTLLQDSVFHEQLSLLYEVIEEPGPDDLPVLMILTAKQIGHAYLYPETLKARPEFETSRQLFELEAARFWCDWGFRLVACVGNINYSERTPNYVFVSERLRPKVKSHVAIYYNDKSNMAPMGLGLSCGFMTLTAPAEQPWIDHKPGTYTQCPATMWMLTPASPMSKVLQDMSQDPVHTLFKIAKVYTSTHGSELWLRAPYLVNTAAGAGARVPESQSLHLRDEFSLPWEDTPTPPKEVPSAPERTIRSAAVPGALTPLEVGAGTPAPGAALGVCAIRSLRARVHQLHHALCACGKESSPNEQPKQPSKRNTLNPSKLR